jgi:hypothetical protein
MPVVQIIAGHSVLYSSNNGFTMTEYDDQEFYEVPPHVASGMMVRGWARVIVPPYAPAQSPPPEAAPEPPEPPKDEPERTKKRGNKP